VRRLVEEARGALDADLDDPAVRRAGDQAAQPALLVDQRGVVFEHPGPLALLDVGAVAYLEDHTVDAGALQEVTQGQAGHASADDRHAPGLCVHDHRL
jgi:hypothetical protein